MLDLTFKGNIAVVINNNETLLEKAKRLYPVGTKFKVAHIPQHICEVKNHNYYFFQTNDICNLNIVEPINGCNAGSVYYKGKWAEIVEYSHGFKVGDKIKIKTNPVMFSKPQYLENIYIIIRIEGNVLFYGLNNHCRVLAKNAIKIN